MENTPSAPAPTKVRDVWSQGKRIDARVAKATAKMEALLREIADLSAQKAEIGAVISGGK